MKIKFLKDLPGIKLGSEIEWPDGCGSLRFIHGLTIEKHLIERNPEWFKLIEEKTDEEVLAEWVGKYTFEDGCTSRDIARTILKAFPSIKQDLEKLK